MRPFGLPDAAYACATLFPSVSGKPRHANLQLNLGRRARQGERVRGRMGERMGERERKQENGERMSAWVRA